MQKPLADSLTHPQGRKWPSESIGIKFGAMENWVLHLSAFKSSEECKQILSYFDHPSGWRYGCLKYYSWRK